MTRDGIWDLIYDLIDESVRDKIVLYTGVKKYEDEVNWIVDSIEDLAAKIEDKMKEAV